MAVFDPKNPQLGSINLGARVSKPLRSIMSSGSRLMSNNKFIKAMRAGLTESGKMSEKLARKVSIRAAAGVKDLGLESAKQKKVFTDEMYEQGMLSTEFKRNHKNALTAYEHAAETMAPVEPKKPAHTLRANVANENEEHNLAHDREAAEHRHDTHDRMQKIRDEIERQKLEKQNREVSATQKFRADERAGATTSINHLSGVHHQEIVPSAPGQNLNMNARQAGAAASLNQALNQKAANTNEEMAAVNDNEEENGIARAT